MSRRRHPRHDIEESHDPDDRYAGIDVEDGYLLYDTETETAWIESDTTVGPEEMV